MASNDGQTWKLLLILMGLLLSNVTGEIIQGPSGGTFLKGNDIKLTCIATNFTTFVLWEELSDDTPIFIGKKKNTNKEKYDNFKISNEEDDFSMTIQSAETSDDGVYICKDGDQHVNATVTVAVQPKVILFISPADPVTDLQRVNITCYAYDGKPAVSWFEIAVNNEPPMGVTPTITVQPDPFETKYNSSATVLYTLISQDISVTCLSHTFGTPQIYSESFAKPQCNITESDDQLKCQCQASPPVISYHFNVDGNMQEGDTLDRTDELFSKSITCVGDNAIGGGKSSSFIIEKETNMFYVVVVVVVVGILALIAAMLGILCRIKNKRNREKADICLNSAEMGVRPRNQDQPVESSENEETTNLLETKADNDRLDEKREFESSENEETTNLLEAKADNDRLDEKRESDLRYYCNILCKELDLEWEIFAVEILDISKEKVLEIIICCDDKNEAIKHVFDMWKAEYGKNQKVSRDSLEKVINEKQALFNEIKSQAKPEKYAEVIDESGSISQNFLSLLSNCAKFIGDIGSNRICKAYGISDSRKEKGPEYFGANLLSLMLQRDLLKDTVESRRKFCNKLDDANLLRAKEEVTKYDKELQHTFTEVSENKGSDRHHFVQNGLTMNEEDMKLLQDSDSADNADLSKYCNTLCEELDLEWEIFAVEILDVSKEKVMKIIMCFDDKNEAIKRVFDMWKAGYGKDQEVSKDILEKVINEKQALFNEIKSQEKPENYSDVIDESGSISQDFSLVLSNCAKFIGDIGSNRICEAYGIIDSKKEKGSEHYPAKLLSLMLQKELLHDTVESRWKLCNKLDDANLLRAKEEVTKYVEKELQHTFTEVSESRASDWDQFVLKGLALNEDDIKQLLDNDSADKDKVRKALSIWLRQTNNWDTDTENTIRSFKEEGTEE